MGKHPKTVEGFVGTLDQLVNSISNLSYNYTASFIEKLAYDIHEQADADYGRGRKKLSLELYATAEILYESRKRMDLARKICESDMKECKTIEGYSGSLEELAKAIGNMTYDQTASFIGKFASQLYRQADVYRTGGKVKLAISLYATADKLYQARHKMDSAWQICKPYMKD